MRKVFSVILALAMILSLAACGETKTAQTEGKKTFKVGICNYVDDASLNQICENVEAQITALAAQQGFEVEFDYDNCNADAAVLNQIIANFIADDVDIMVGIATPVAMAMQAATEDNQIPVVFAAVSDPVGCGIVESLDAPGANITGTSDYLNADAVMDLISAVNPDIDSIALLYDLSQDSSTTAIASAKAKLDAAGIQYTEFTASNTSEATLAAQAIVDGGYKAVFTPTDNTIMTAELSIYEIFANGGVQHYAGADSFALNGAFIGYGVDYANLGKETGNMAVDILNGADPASTGVMTFDNGIAVVNTEVCEALGFTFDDVSAAIADLCTNVSQIETSESF